MVKLVSKIISKIKHREYIIDENITDNDLFSIVFTRFFMLIRGFFATLGFKKSGKISFIGKKVCIKSKSHIECGSGLTINDNCTINALCKNGIKIGNNFSLGQNSIIECTGVIRELGESLVIGDNVGISANAFKNNQLLRTTVIGRNVRRIGKQAFYNCKNLRTITIRTSMLTKKNIGTKAFKGTYKNIKVKVPAKQFKTYKKFFKSKGMSTKAIYKK